MHTIGIDPGRKNLGMCMMDDKDVIVQWNVISIHPDPKGIIEALEKIKFFDEWLQNSPDVVIERQPSKNPQAIRIQHYLEMIISAKGGSVYIIDPKHKLSHASSTEWWPQREINSWNYGERKKLSVETVSSFLKSTEQDPKFAEFFQNSKKKDDLADALLHCLAFKHIKSSIGARRVSAVRSIKPVKPSDAQMKSGKYTQGGLKYLARGCLSSFDIFERTVSNISGFCSSACKHFETLDNAYLQLGGKS